MIVTRFRASTKFGLQVCSFSLSAPIQQNSGAHTGSWRIGKASLSARMYQTNSRNRFGAAPHLSIVLFLRRSLVFSLRRSMAKAFQQEALTAGQATHQSPDDARPIRRREGERMIFRTLPRKVQKNSMASTVLRFGASLLIHWNGCVIAAFG